MSFLPLRFLNPHVSVSIKYQPLNINSKEGGSPGLWRRRILLNQPACLLHLPAKNPEPPSPPSPSILLAAPTSFPTLRWCPVLFYPSVSTKLTLAFHYIDHGRGRDCIWTTHYQPERAQGRHLQYEHSHTSTHLPPHSHPQQFCTNIQSTQSVH